MPKQIGQEAESILNQTAAQKKATAPKATASYAYGKVPLPSKPVNVLPYKPITALPNAGVINQYAPTTQYPSVTPPPNSSKVVPQSAIPTWVGTPQFNMPTYNGSGNSSTSDPRFDINNIINGMMQNGGRMGGDLDVQSLMTNPNIREAINTRFPGGATYEDVMNYLQDNYSWLFTERTAVLPDNGGGGGGGGGTGLETQVPLPDMSWGGGGYGDNNYLRDSGLINWRI